MATAMMVERRQVALGSGGMRGGLWPDDFLILEADEDEVRIAHYRVRRPHETTVRHVDDQSWAGLLENSYVHPAEKQHAWLRRAARGPSTLGVLAAVFERDNHDPQTVFTYLRSTSWGERLP